MVHGNVVPHKIKTTFRTDSLQARGKTPDLHLSEEFPCGCSAKRLPFRLASLDILN